MQHQPSVDKGHHEWPCVFAKARVVAFWGVHRMKLHRVTEKLDVNDADLSGSQFNDANLSGSTFKQINFSGARFDDSNMTGWHLNDVNLSGAVFHNLDLSGAALTNCRLTGVTIDGVALEEMSALYRRSAAQS